MHTSAVYNKKPFDNKIMVKITRIDDNDDNDDSYEEITATNIIRRKRGGG